MKPDSDLQQQTRWIVEKHNLRWGAGDLAGIFSLYDADMAFTDHYTGKTYTGAGLRRHITQVIGRSRLDSLTYTDAIRVDGDTAVLQYSETIRSASGNDLLQIRACDVVRVRHGLIVDIQEYALPVQPGDSRTTATASAEKIGLTARGLGYLLDDLATYFERNHPFLRPGLSLLDVAKATGYSRNQISFALNQGLQTTFYAYINRARIEYLLRQDQTLLPEGIHQVCKATGFRSVSTFYAAFRAVTGKRPKDYFS
jgi:AraC-like DNA-binding protein/ketosteroid isomerase-like protein